MSNEPNRREFLKSTTLAAAGVSLAGAGAVQAADAARCPVGANKDAELKISMQWGKVMDLPKDQPAEQQLDAQLDLMEKLGVVGLEPYGGQFRGGANVKTFKDRLRGRAVKISAICAGFDGWLIASDKAERDKAITSIKELLDAAGELGSVGLIFVPAFNHQASLPDKEARTLLTGFPRWDRKPEQAAGLLAELGDYAAQRGTKILLEPLNRDECYFVRTLAEAASICKDLDHPGVAMMGDFWHMTWEETSDIGAFISAGKYLAHVHMASRRTRSMPTEDGEADNYVDGFKALKWIGYSGYVSFECGCKGDRSQIVPAAIKLLREQWNRA